MSTKIPVVDLKGKNVGEAEVLESLFAAEPNEAVVHFACEGQRFRFYKKNASTKGRSAVSGGGKKSRKQKGTGGARQGGTRAPHWVGGGTAFGPKGIKRDFKINRKVLHTALASVVSDRHSGGQVRLLKESSLTKPQTKTLSSFISELALKGARIGFVISRTEDSNLLRSVRNIRNVDVLTEEKWTPLDVVKTDSIVFSQSGLDSFQKKFSKSGSTSTKKSKTKGEA